VPRARDALLSLGYEAVEGLEGFPVDHLPAMIRKAGWGWRGNYFDPEIPPSVDLHFRFWDADTESFEAPGVDQFWFRRVEQYVDGRRIPALHPADSLGYSALHFLRHWLRGSLRPNNVYELAYFLDTHAADEDFWSAWRELHPAALRRLEGLCFRLASEWFGCRLAGAVEQEMRSAGEDVQVWFERCGASPMEGLFRPNKDEVWLHYCLLGSGGARRKVLRRRLLPVRLPPPNEPYVPDEQVSRQVRLRKQARYAAHVIDRALHHVRALAPTLWRGRSWLRRGGGLGKTFWMFMAAASLFNFSTFIFLLLYNLYLLDAGFGESVLGVVTGATAAGSVAATLPAALLARRWGLRRTLLLCFLAAAGVGVCRALLRSPPALVVFAFLGGVVFAIFAVSIAPLIALLAGEQKRPRAFSVFFSSSIALGILGGLAGGALPGWIARTVPALDGGTAKQAALLVACAFGVLALWPASRLRIPAIAGEARLYPRNRFVGRFLLVLGVWNLATGAFNPFFNAFFARRLQVPVEWIGAVFSGGQLAQVAAVLAAPVVLRRFGLVPGIAGMQLATGVALGCLAGSGTAPVAAAFYMTYVALQWMSEPGMYSLLMNRVKPGEQSGASALNFLVAFSSQALAASLAGLGYARLGYPAVMGLAAGGAVVSGFLFRKLLAGPHSDERAAGSPGA
jgi:MFS family permease